MAFRAFALLLLFFADVQSEDPCSGALSDGPEDADVEIVLGHLPPSTSLFQQVLYWRAARKSNTPYNPITNPGAAQVYPDQRQAYPSLGDPDWNGGKVVISENGTAKIRVRAPATYSSSKSGPTRAPHVHYGFCPYGGAHPEKISFGSDGRKKGVYAKAGGGCGMGMMKMPSGMVLEVNHLSPVKMLEEDPEEKDWDALEFSPVHQCLLEEGSVYDHFAADCVKSCPSSSELKHRQCVRPQGASPQPSSLAASWSLRIECDEKCWAASMNVTMHGIRLAVADHLDVPFQEVKDVHLWKDAGAPAMDAHLRIKVFTDRLGADHGNSLLQGFVPNVAFASKLLGLTVHEMKAPDDAPIPPSASSVSPEKPDQYDEFYTKLIDDKQQTEVAGVPVPNEVPVAAFIGAAAGVLLLGVMVVVFLHRRRKQQQQATAAKAEATTEEATAEAKIEEANIEGKIEEATL